MAATRRPLLDLSMSYTGGVVLPTSEEAGFNAHANAQGSNLTFVRAGGTTAQRPLAPFVGWFYYDTTLSEIIVYNGTAWESVATGNPV